MRDKERGGGRERKVESGREREWEGMRRGSGGGRKGEGRREE